jgi:hypothetical protein
MAIPLAQLGKAVSNPRGLARRAIQNSDWLEALIQGLESDTARTKYGCAKALRVVAEARPDVLYPRFDFFVSLLEGDNKILQWEALFVLSRLARVDAGNRLEGVFERYFAAIPGPVMITAANAIRGGAEIAMAKPELADRIAREILKVEKARYQTPECRHVAIGHAIVALGEVLDRLDNLEAVMAFVRKQVRNPRPATRKKAEQFLKRALRCSRPGEAAATNN